MPTVSLLFAPGERPHAPVIVSHARDGGGYSVSLDPKAEEAEPEVGNRDSRWLELLANGLTFDLLGLAPGPAAGAPPSGHVYGLPAEIGSERLEALVLQPGPHLAAAASMLPVVRSLAWLAARLATLPRTRAVVWHPARSWCSPEHFFESVMRWIDGGVFPGFGLAALVPMPDGGMRSEGMALFVGQELRLEPELAEDRAAGARTGLRLLHWLSEHGRLSGPETLTGPDGVALRLEPSANGRFVRVWKK